MAGKAHPDQTPMVETIRSIRGGKPFNRQMIGGRLRNTRPAEMPELETPNYDYQGFYEQGVSKIPSSLLEAIKQIQRK